MAVKASASITIFDVVDIDSVTWFYLLQSSTANPPAVPTTYTPSSSWSTTEPTYTEGSTNTLYTTCRTIYSDGTFSYSPVSKSTQYEASKVAYNKAVNATTTANNAQSTANTANNAINNLQIGGTNYISNNSDNWVNANWSIPAVGGVPALGGYDGRISLKEKIAITPNTNYWVKVYSSKNVNVLFRVLDVDGKFLKSDIGMNNQLWTSPANCYFVNVTVYENSTVDDITNGTTKIKFEKGNRATDWSPAPEDVDADINDLSTEVESLNGDVNALGQANEVNEQKLKQIIADINGLTILAPNSGNSVNVNDESVDIKQNNTVVASYKSDGFSTGDWQVQRSNGGKTLSFYRKVN